MKLYHFLVLIFISVYFFQCGNGNSTDDIKKHDITYSSDSTILSRIRKSDKNDSNFEEVNLDTVLNEYYRDCRDTFRFDTSVTINKKLIGVHFKHYSTNDSTIHLPDNWVARYGLRNFVTHDFESHLQLTANDSILVDAHIDKDMFIQYADPEEVSYAALRAPTIKLDANGLHIHYSYVIALTDIGFGVSVECDYTGKLKVIGHN